MSTNSIGGDALGTGGMIPSPGGTGEVPVNLGTERDDGGAAFPCGSYDPQTAAVQPPVHAGMSLRDWFAGQALAAMTAAPDYSQGPCDEAMAKRAFRIADYALAARKAAP